MKTKSQIANLYKDADKITLVMDNLNPHTPGSLYEAFPPDEAKALWDRFEFVYTPKHGRRRGCCNILVGKGLQNIIETPKIPSSYTNKKGKRRSL